MSKYNHSKNYRKLYPNASDEVIAALRQSDEKIRYTEHDLKHRKYDGEKKEYKKSREISLQMMEETGVQFSEISESLEDIVVRSIMIEKMIKAVDQLLPEEKKLIFYYFVSEKSQEECAKLLGTPQRTISDRLKKIYEKLKKYIEI